MAKFGRLIDTKRCMGCRSCVAACAVENHFTPDAQWNAMIEYEVGTYPEVHKIYNTMNCMHCEKPSCKAVCDKIGVKAISKNEYGVVLIDYKKCIGCGYCAAVCPYGVPQMNTELKPLNPGKGAQGMETIAYADRHPTHQKKAKTAEKCTFCWHKIEKAIKDGSRIASARIRTTRRPVIWFARRRRAGLATSTIRSPKSRCASRQPVPCN